MGLLVAGTVSCGRIGFDAGSDASGDASGDASSSDDALTIDAMPCISGGLALPIAAVDRSLNAGDSCEQTNILVEDGVIAGLERHNVGALDFIDGQEVAGCILVDFGELAVFDPIVVRAQPVADACGQPCGGGLCGTGHELSLFAGPTSAALTLVAYQTFGSSALANYSFTIGPLRYVAVCRTSYSLDRDDVGVDVIRGTCP